MPWAVGLYLAIGVAVATGMANSPRYDQGAALFVIRTFVWPLALVK